MEEKSSANRLSGSKTQNSPQNKLLISNLLLVPVIYFIDSFGNHFDRGAIMSYRYYLSPLINHRMVVTNELLLSSLLVHVEVPETVAAPATGGLRVPCRTLVLLLFSVTRSKQNVHGIDVLEKIIRRQKK